MKKTNKMKTKVSYEQYELIPRNGAQSFYGKAKIIQTTDGWKFLLSYETIIGAKEPDGTEHRYSERVSHTTNCHAKSFFRYDFWKLPLEEKPKIKLVFII